MVNFYTFNFRDEIKELMDSKYLEHDSYFFFTYVMERIESWYDNNSIKTIKKHEYLNVEPFSNDNDFNCYSKIGIKLKMIMEQILRRYDEKLYNHLKELKIAPQIYGIRWMRLLFIREFQMQDLLVLWDAIFANDLSLCDYIFTAMLVVIRNLLLPCDYAECLNHLMRYPSVCDVHYVIHLALHIRDPNKYPEPIEHSTLVLPNPNAIKVQMANRIPASASNKLNGTNNVNETKAINESKNNGFEWIEDKLVKLQGTNETSNGRNSSDQLGKEIKELKEKVDFCSHYMTKHLDILQQFINNQCNNHLNDAAGGQHSDQDFESKMDNVLISIAELKKIRDILRGTLSIKPSFHLL